MSADERDRTGRGTPDGGPNGEPSPEGGVPGGDASDPRAARQRELRAQLRALADAGATPQELAIHLAASGYDAERAAALLDQLAADRPTDPTGGAPSAGAAPAGPTLGGAADHGTPIRVWAPFERARFTPEAWGRLLHLRADRMGDAEFEHLVDRALLQLDGVVSVSELRALLGDAADTAAPPTVH